MLASLCCLDCKQSPLQRAVLPLFWLDQLFWIALRLQLRTNFVVVQDQNLQHSSKLNLTLMLGHQVSQYLAFWLALHSFPCSLYWESSLAEVQLQTLHYHFCSLLHLDLTLKPFVLLYQLVALQTTALQV